MLEAAESRDLTTVSSTVCRICQTNATCENLISPCNCKGSLAYVHLSCLEMWLNQSSRTDCELCTFHYNSVQTQRYTMAQAIRLWFRHPTNRIHVRSDLLVTLLLTTVTIGLVIVCALGIEHFVIEGKRLGMSAIFIRLVIGVFLGLVLLGYAVTLYLLVKDQVMPWYNWWKNTMDVRVLMNDGDIHV